MADPDPLQLKTVVQNRLITSLPGAEVFDGYVPDKVPMDDYGFIRPYVVLFAGVGAPIAGEVDLSLIPSLDGIAWAAQTQCVGANVDHVLYLSNQVRQALNEYPVGTGWLKHDDDSFTPPVPLLDPQASPARLFLPLRWRLTTT